MSANKDRPSARMYTHTCGPVFIAGSFRDWCASRTGEGKKGWYSGVVLAEVLELSLRAAHTKQRKGELLNNRIHDSYS